MASRKRNRWWSNGNGGKGSGSHSSHDSHHRVNSVGLGEAMIDPRMSLNFRRSEFCCHCPCGSCLIQKGIVRALQEVRDLVGSPMVITSGYRCPVHNDQIGGASHSMHMVGIAADVFFVGQPMWYAYEAVRRVRPWSQDHGGIGLYPPWESAGGKARGNFIHLDTRETEARWAKYKGKKIAFEEALELIRVDDTDPDIDPSSNGGTPCSRC